MSACASLSQVPAVKYESLSTAAPCSLVPGGDVYFDNCVKSKKLTKSFHPFCTEMVDTNTWLSRYGLKANKLTYQNILSMIGFKQTQNYEDPLKKQITSKYGRGLFLKTQSSDGTVYNITVEASRIADFELRLVDAIELFQSRLSWVNSDSRRIFGVIQEKNICLVLDCKQQNQPQFNQFKASILNLLCEQVTRCARFNIIRCMCDQTNEMFHDTSVNVTAQSIEEAIEWLHTACWCHLENRPDCRECDKSRLFTDTSTCEGVIRAFEDQSLDAVYLISEGVSSNALREILYDKLVKESFSKRTRLNVVSYNCNDLATVEYLKRIAVNSFGPGRFHAYCLLRKLEDYAPGPICSGPTMNNITVNRLGFGGTPPGSGVKSDVMLLFEEIQQAKEALSNLKIIIKSMNDVRIAEQANKLIVQAPLLQGRRRQERSDEYMTSREWLATNGLRPKKLDLFEALKSVCFKHCDGVVDVKQEPNGGKLEFFGDGKQYYKGDAIPREKLINARYCDQFAHVLWHDGTIVHVHVTPEMHRNYEKRIKIAIEQYEKRLDWLSHGSRELFGTVIENNICFLIDTSQSMETSLEFVKEKLKILLAEQLKTKTRFNLVAFNTRVTPWRDRMVDVDEHGIQSALSWIQSLYAQGTTNTLAAIRFALNDVNTEAIYLLSDGRPDQEPRQILSQVSLNIKIPIHTISFNCTDREANGFLSDLARETNGRYHFFHQNQWDADPEGLVPYHSEDSSLLKQEIQKGIQFLNQIVKLRDECMRLSKSENRNNFEIKPRNELAKSEIYKYSDLLTENGLQTKYRPKEKENLSKSDAQGMLFTLHDIQSLDWVLPETRMLLEKQFTNELNQSKKHNSKYHNHCMPLIEVVKKPKPFKAKKYKSKVASRETSPAKNDFSSFKFNDDISMTSDRSESVKNVLLEKIMEKTKDEKRLNRGTKVIARNDILGYYFPGKVTRVIDSRTLNVKFDDDYRQNDMSCHNIIKLDCSGYLSVGDYVMASVLNEYDDRCWVPGIVQTKLIQIDPKSFPKLFTILYFNGQEGDNCRAELIKINKHIYGSAVNYIRTKLGLGTNVKEGIVIEKEEEQSRSPSPEVKKKSPRAPSPDLNYLKSEILDEIKVYFNSLKLDTKYQEMFDEFLKLRRNHKKLKTDLVDRMQIIRTDFEEWKSKEPKVVKIIEERQPIIKVIEKEKLVERVVEKEVENEVERKSHKQKVKQEQVVPLTRQTVTKVLTPRSPSSSHKSMRSSDSVIELNYSTLVAGLRKKLSQLSVGEEVLAKWPDDGWYYRSVIVESLGNACYRIEDSLNDTEVIYREDIISEKSDSVESVEVGDSVVALHPYFEFSYAPGQIIQVSNDMDKFTVRFYDYVESEVLSRDAYKLNHLKFQADVETINNLEKARIGKTVVSRNTFSNVYELGKIIKRVGNIGRQYVIEWYNGKQSLQNSNHIFGSDTRKPAIIKNDFVLAPKETIFLPGRVIDKKGDQLKVKFVDGVVDENVYYEDCYWLSRDYYEDACSFYRRELDTGEFDVNEQLRLESDEDKFQRKDKNRKRK